MAVDKVPQFGESLVNSVALFCAVWLRPGDAEPTALTTHLLLPI